MKNIYWVQLNTDPIGWTDNERFSFRETAQYIGGPHDLLTSFRLTLIRE